jgi:hypothetical protein
MSDTCASSVEDIINQYEKQYAIGSWTSVFMLDFPNQLHRGNTTYSYFTLMGLSWCLDNMIFNKGSVASADLSLGYQVEFWFMTSQWLSIQALGDDKNFALKRFLF